MLSGSAVIRSFLPVGCKRGGTLNFKARFVFHNIAPAKIAAPIRLEYCSTGCGRTSSIGSSVPEKGGSPPPHDADYSYINGAMRSSLRALAGRKKTDGTLAEVEWTGSSVISAAGGANNNAAELEKLVAAATLDPAWMEKVDSVLWEEELVLLRMKKAVDKKKAAKRLGEKIALLLRAHVAQTIGHTVLLYRPGNPPVLDLFALAASNNSRKP